MTFDGAQRLITLTPGTTALGVRDLWSRWVDWLLAGDNSKHPLALDTLGGQVIDAGAGVQIPVYVFLRNGWKIRPQSLDHTLRVADGILVVDGGGDPFVDPTGDHTVRINFSQPVQALTIDTGGGSGGGGLTPTQAAQLDLMHKVLTGRLETDVATGKLRLYDDGGAVTHEAGIFSDLDGAEPADGTEPVLRRDRLLPVP